MTSNWPLTYLEFKWSKIVEKAKLNKEKVESDSVKIRWKSFTLASLNKAIFGDIFELYIIICIAIQWDNYPDIIIWLLCWMYKVIHSLCECKL